MNTLVTHVAHAGRGDHRYFGHSVLTDLLGSETLTGLVALAVTGRRATSEETKILDALAVSVTAADPRIWPLKVTRLVASYGEMIAGFAAGQLAMLGTYISPRLITSAAEQLSRLRIALAEDDRLSDEIVRDHIVRTGMLDGYGVPLRAEDERLLAIRRFMDGKGRSALPHWRAQRALSAMMWEERRIRPNIGIGLSAALLDLGYSPPQCGAMSTFLLEHDHAANAVEAATQKALEMVRLPDECVEYVGKTARQSPRALQRRTAR
jgi:hypothetical protein